jgi:hypothetical protein
VWNELSVTMFSKSFLSPVTPKPRAWPLTVSSSNSLRAASIRTARSPARIVPLRTSKSSTGPALVSATVSPSSVRPFTIEWPLRSRSTWSAAMVTAAGVPSGQITSASSLTLFVSTSPHATFGGLTGLKWTRALVLP